MNTPEYEKEVTMFHLKQQSEPLQHRGQQPMCLKTVTANTQM